MYEHITQADLSELLKLQDGIYLSLYMPVARTFPDQEQNRTRYRNLLRRLREQLAGYCNGSADPALLEPFDALSQDDDLWDKPRDGLAVVGGAGLFRVFSLAAAGRGHHPGSGLAGCGGVASACRRNHDPTA